MTDDIPAIMDGLTVGVLGSEIDTVREIQSGHIHRTWRAVDMEGRAFAVQALNQRVFPEPVALTENFDTVTTRLLAAGVPTAEPVGLGPSNSMVLSTDGRCWRVTRWVEGRRPDPTNRSDVFETAKAFGQFDACLRGVDGLHEVIADFHNPFLRFDRLHESATADPHDRAGAAAEAIDRVDTLAGAIKPALTARGGLPRRVAHNDAKIDNAIISEDGVITVIDLDTVMPGVIVDDIGELVRSVVRPDEDHVVTDQIPLAMVEAIISGFTEGFGEIAIAEAEMLPWAGLVLTVENATRFLTDFIDGDRYFAVADQTHNLRRALVQLDLAERLRRDHYQMVNLVSKAVRW